ncbi:GNAT family N-acetyltransferase [Ideonella sp.]|uniref:GNAT family N-acetyltransferase n=1 Tax=Ideonella sp. TaxID=1929293 RepID=UPI0035ADE8E5
MSTGTTPHAALPDTVFETHRLRARRLVAADAEAMHRVYGDADAMRWVGDGEPLDRPACEHWVQVTHRNYATRGYGMFTLTDRHGGAVLGFCGLVHPGGQVEAELKYALAREAWGQGLATEAAAAMLCTGHRLFGLAHIIATVAPAHVASQRVLLKAGMRFGAFRPGEGSDAAQCFDWWPDGAAPATVRERPAGPMTACTVTTADPLGDDAQGLLAALSATLQQITGSPGTASFDVADVAQPGAAFVLARTADGRAVGCGALRPLQPGVAELKRMYAAPGTQGVGTQVLAALEAQAPRLGHRELWLETRRVNARAVAFYLRHGYAVIPNYGRYAGRAEAVCFGKRLPA